MAGLLWVPSFSQIRCTSRCSGTWLSILVKNFLNSIARWRRWVELITVPSAVLNAANKLVVPWRRSSWVRFSGIPGIIGNAGCERANACT